jgi:acetolactate synthase-1/2/3 large subunit
MKVSEYVAQFLDAQGVTTVYCLVGGMITHLLDSMHRQGQIRIVDVHHEQGAAFAAEGWARIGGIPGVALATSGPGATNLITGIGSCYFDSVPAVFLTGQVNRNEQKGERAIRQLGFQETDITAVVRPLTKAAWKVSTPEEVPDLLERAFRLALSGRPGPVLLDIPMDVQYADIDAEPPRQVTAEAGPAVDPAQVRALLAAMSRAERPLILAGGGLRSGGAVEVFRRFVERMQVPVVHSLMGVDALPFAHPQHVGLIGSYGNRWANLAVGQSDFLLVLGSRLDIRQTGAQADAFKAGREIYHVDIDPGEINNRVTGSVPLVGQLRDVLEAALDVSKGPLFPDRGAWQAEIATLRALWPDTGELRRIEGINPNALMHALAQGCTEAGCWAVDVGQHQMWAAQSIEVGPDQRFLTSGGMGSMGFALPAAIGAAVAGAGPVMMIAGDGGFQCNIQELQTVARNDLPIKMVILNNRTHGMVRQFQESYYDGRYQSTLWGYSAPDFVAVARGYGIAAAAVNEAADLEVGLAALWAQRDKPFLLEVRIDTYANAYPKLAFGHGITEMEPFVKPLGMEGT